MESQCHTCVVEHRLLSARKQPATPERAVYLHWGPCPSSELAFCSSVKPQEQQYCLSVLITDCNEMLTRPFSGDRKSKGHYKLCNLLSATSLAVAPSPRKVPARMIS